MAIVTLFSSAPADTTIQRAILRIAWHIGGIRDACKTEALCRSTLRNSCKLCLKSSDFAAQAVKGTIPEVSEPTPPGAAAADPCPTRFPSMHQQRHSENEPPQPAFERARFRAGSIRTRFLGVLLLAMLPALLYTFHVHSQQRRQAVDVLQQEAARVLLQAMRDREAQAENARPLASANGASGAATRSIADPRLLERLALSSRLPANATIAVFDAEGTLAG
ncbi:MAG: hypothetical protein ING77_08250, partial [Rhodocyclaceae bacterium]|nr:hypothetical protein [Rhodocyclaceae bacterium]